MTETPVIPTEDNTRKEPAKRPYQWGNPSKKWLYVLLTLTTVFLIAGIGAISRGGVAGAPLALLFCALGLTLAFACGARFPWSRKPSPEWAPKATPAAVGGLLALIVSTIATGLDGDNEQLKIWIFGISSVGIVLSLLLLPAGWRGDSQLERTEEELQETKDKLERSESSNQVAQAKILAMTEQIDKKDAEIAVLTEQIGSKSTTPSVPSGELGLAARAVHAARIVFGRRSK